MLPLLKKHCYECHSHEFESAEGGLVLDGRKGWEVGGDSGPAIIPGETGKSLLLKAVEYSDSELQMPPDSKLSGDDIEILRRWIADGAFDPRISRHRQSEVTTDSINASKELWSLQPVGEVDVPDLDDEDWGLNDIDRFIFAKIREQKLAPNSQADRYTLLRRATFDLTGLPPTLSEIEDFSSDTSPDAYERLIDRLLESPHYGERWGRHWLDLARYGDSNGGDINYAHANAWKYRDYVARSFNDDKPYDDFIREQLAGDLLTSDVDEDRRREMLTATGFLMLGPKMLAEADTDKLLIDIVDEQLDVTGLTFLGMTFGCARCHDHKFDPISTEDYYAMAGIFRSTKTIDKYRTPGGVAEWLEVDVTPAETRAEIARLNAERKRLRNALADLGETETAKGRGEKYASRAIVARELPMLESTTWAAWARISEPQKLGAVISAAYPGANQGHSLGFDQGSTPRVVWNHGKGVHTIIAASQAVSFDEWHHLALSFDAESRRLRLFVDGAEAASAENVATSRFSRIGVGRREAAQEWQFTGDIDDVRVYGTVLNDAEILELSRWRPPKTLPVLHWDFDELTSEGLVASGKGRISGQIVGTSSRNVLIDDGSVGKALSFSRLLSESSSDSERTGQVSNLRSQIKKLEATVPETSLVMAVGELLPVDLAVHIRGSHTKIGTQTIPRSTPKVFDDRLQRVVVPKNKNGRLQLAEWIAHPKNPLTARVMVNRIWQYHFETGLVRTASNFGARGEEPSHPLLLDWLANEFVKNGWSIKHMHCLIMNSATYRQSSVIHQKSKSADPENRLLNRFPIQRLEAEAIRDSLLAVTGELDRTFGGSLLKAKNKKRVTMTPVDPVYESFRRSVYLPTIRVRGYQLFSVFDVSDSGQHVAARSQTMVAQQALFLMNNPLVTGRSKVLATQTVKQRATEFSTRSDRLHRLIYGRPATSRENSVLHAVHRSMVETEKRAGRNEQEAELFAWQHIIHTMLCSNEFIHIR